MPKLKTKSGAKKRFSLTSSGKVRGSPAFLSHNLRKRSQKMKRQARGTIILNECDAKIVKQFIPCLLYTSPSPRDISGSRMPSSA